ncbi:MAG: GAF domain-containing protein [Acidimicrobiales bacterium]
MPAAPEVPGGARNRRRGRGSVPGPENVPARPIILDQTSSASQPPDVPVPRRAHEPLSRSRTVSASSQAEPREQEASRFRVMADLSPVLMWMSAPDARCTFVNKVWLDFTGRNLDDELGDGWAENVHPDDLKRCLEVYRVAFERRERFEMEYRLRRTDGVYRWMLDWGVPYHAAGGDFAGYLGCCVDVTSHRNTEEELLRSRRELDSVLAAGRMGTWAWDRTTDTVVRDTNLDGLYGLEPGHGPGTFEEWAGLVHPDDRPWVLEAVERVASEGGTYHFEHRMVRPDGTVVWVERRGEAYCEEAGRPAGIRGLVVDVSERKEAEVERALLLERVTRLQAVTAELSGAGTPDEVLDAVTDRGIEAMGASAGAVALVDASASGLTMARAQGYPPAMVGTLATMDLDGWLPLAEAARSRAPVLVADRHALERCYPGLVAHLGETVHSAIAAVPLVFQDRVLGAIGLSFSRSQTFDEAQVAFLEAVAAQCAQALERARLYAAEAEARAVAEHNARRLADLQTVVSGLADARTAVDAAGVVIDKGTEALGAASGMLCLLDDGNSVLEAVHHVGYDPGSVQRFRRFSVDDNLPASDAIRSRQTVLLRSLEERDERYPKLRGLVAHNHAFAIVPLLVGRQPIGSVVFGWAEEREFNEDDRRFLLTLGQHAAQALDRVQAYEAEQRTAERQAMLSETSRVLGSSLDYETTLSMVARLAVPGFADSCSVHVLDDDRLQTVAVANVDPEREELMRAATQRPPSEHLAPLREVLATGRTLVVADVDDRALRRSTDDPEQLELLRRLAIRSGVAVALEAADNAVGVLVLGMAGSGRRFRAADIPFVEDLAARAGMAIANARLHRGRTEVARTLQKSLLPHGLPLIPGIDIAARYRPVGDGSEVGGDFYDVFRSGDGRWGVVIGDVSGKGVLAASLTALARYTVQTAARQGDPPSAVLQVLNRSVVEHNVGERFCTVALAMVEPLDGTLRVTAAFGGHPPLLRIEPDGVVRPFGRSGSAVGLLETPSFLDEATVLHEGEALVFYTDGALEARSPQGDFADGLLEATLARTAGASADAIAGAVEEAILSFQGGRARDDMAVVVLRQPAGALRVRFAPAPVSVPRARAELRAWTVGHALETRVVDDLLLVVTELAANAVAAARTEFQLRAWRDGDGIVLEVSDDGPGFEGGMPPSGGVPDIHATRGRGIPLVRSIMDSCRFQSGLGQTLIRCRRRATP